MRRCNTDPRPWLFWKDGQDEHSVLPFMLTETLCRGRLAGLVTLRSDVGSVNPVPFTLRVYSPLEKAILI